MIPWYNTRTISSYKYITVFRTYTHFCDIKSSKILKITTFVAQTNAKDTIEMYRSVYYKKKKQEDSRRTLNFKNINVPFWTYQEQTFPTHISFPCSTRFYHVLIILCVPFQANTIKTLL